MASGLKIKLPVSPELAQYAKWRVWAADVRDRKGKHRSLPNEVSERAETLVWLMDQMDEQAKRVDAAANMTQPLEVAILSTIGWIFLKGASRPE